LPFPPGAVPGVEILCILAPLDTVPFDTTSSSVGGKCVKCSIRTSCVAVEKENVVREDSSFECCFTTLDTVTYRWFPLLETHNQNNPFTLCQQIPTVF
jgi:hypothetical protein